MGTLLQGLGCLSSPVRASVNHNLQLCGSQEDCA